MPEKLEQPHKESPFREPLVESNLPRERLRTLRGRPDVVIRSETLQRLAKQYGMENPLDAVREAKRLFDELRTTYGVRISGDFLVGKDEEENPALFVVADRIEGRDPLHGHDDPSDERHIAEELRELFSSLVDYLSDKCRSGDYFLWDIMRSEQYIYGAKKGEREKHLYLTDIELDFVSRNAARNEPLSDDRREDISAFATELAYFIEDSETALHADFADAWKKLQDFCVSVADAELRNDLRAIVF